MQRIICADWSNTPETGDREIQRFILLRLGQAILSLWVVSVIVFGLGRITGDPVDVMLPIDATHEERKQLREQLGFNAPIWTQYANYMRNSFKGQFGESIKYPDYETIGLVLDRFPSTIKLALVAIAFSVVAIPIGVLSAVKKDSIFDWSGKTIALLGQSFPFSHNVLRQHYPCALPGACSSNLHIPFHFPQCYPVKNSRDAPGVYGY